MGAISRKKICLLGAIALFLCACSPFSSQVKREINPSLTLTEILSDPQRFQGETALMGGRILFTQVKAGETILEVLQFPLDYRDRPKPSNETQGRFLAVFTKYLDPAIFSQGRLITIVGQVAGTKKGRIGEVEYTYPVLLTKNMYLWEPEGSGPPAVTFGIGIGAIF